MSLAEKTAFSNVAVSQTDSQLVAADTANRMIRVDYVIISCGATAQTGVTFNTKGSGAGTAISATLTPGAGQTITLEAVGGNGLFITKAKEALTVTTGTGSTVGIQVGYTFT